MRAIFDKVSLRASKMLTRAYSTSFSLGIRFLAAEIRNPVYAIYGFVRLGDEIVDTFHTHDKKRLLSTFREDVFKSIREGISLNPILNSFQWAVNKNSIDDELIELFLQSMEMDLDKTRYDQAGYERYILGSAEVVGLMCLRVFCKGDDSKYQRLKPFAMKLGSAYQKINFLRDLNADFGLLNRVYFPGVDFSGFGEKEKQRLITEIEADFAEGYKGIRQLPAGAKFGVYLSYVYYYNLLQKIKVVNAERLKEARIRISNRRKYYLLGKSVVKFKLNMV